MQIIVKLLMYKIPYEKDFIIAKTILLLKILVRKDTEEAISKDKRLEPFMLDYIKYSLGLLKDNSTKVTPDV